MLGVGEGWLGGRGGGLATFEVDGHCGHAVVGCNAHLGRWDGSTAGETGRSTWTGHTWVEHWGSQGEDIFVSRGTCLHEQLTRSSALACPVGEPAHGLEL